MYLGLLHSCAAKARANQSLKRDCRRCLAPWQMEPCREHFCRASSGSWFATPMKGTMRESRLPFPEHETLEICSLQLLEGA